ncbi:MAG: hypothetical protein KC729_08675 [Candidatus Eisenbacteria bacterium]|uniref:Histidine kinase domain-containing protein n=1 Tax=Eiseniibacteriota bacterium TaxID=2212470 RepID=A0A956LYV8_UNCEI|nr:hypothetical protein [Candidatus Eisenbacteria bacterium]
MKLDPDTPAPRETSQEQPPEYSASPQVAVGFSPGWHGLCESIRQLGHPDEVALAAVALAVDPKIGAGAAAYFQVDVESGRLRGLEAGLPGDRALATKLRETAPGDVGSLAGLLADARKSHHAAGSPAASLRRVRFSLRDEALGPVLAALGGSPATPTEHPLELSRILGDGSWSYWPVAYDGHTEAVLCLRDLPHPGVPLGSLLDACAAAVSRIRLNARVKSLERRAKTVAELSHRVLTASTLEDLLDAVARSAARTLDAHWATIWTTNGSESSLRVAVHCGQNAADESETQFRQEQALRCLEDLRARPLVDARGEIIGTLAPLHAFETPLGVIAVADGGHEWEPERKGHDRTFLESVAALAALALRHVDLRSELRLVAQRERELQGMLQQSERLAGMGETSAQLARQLEVPLNAIGESAKNLAAAVPDGDPRAGQADLIAREARRLLALVREQVALMQLDPPRLRMVHLAEIARDAFAQARGPLEKAGVRIEEQHAPDQPALLLDQEKVRQVILRIVENVGEGLVRGGRFALRTGREGPNVFIDVASEAEPPDGGIIDRLFLPFDGGRGAAGLGLAVARQIVLDHGGEIQVSSDDTWATRFRVSFPVRDNQDRRRPRADRRAGRERRRAA